MFELTIKGITKQFNTAEEMDLWRQSMAAPRIKNKLPKKPHKRKSITLKNFIEKVKGGK
jgi:hypothetical protein